MSLMGYVSSGFESLGLNGSGVKPINEGERVTVVGEETPSGNLWGIFDGVGETLNEGGRALLDATVDRYVTKTRTGPEGSPDSTGDPSDNPQSSTIPESQRRQPSFFSRYKSELIVGGVLLGGFLIVVNRR